MDSERAHYQESVGRIEAKWAAEKAAKLEAKKQNKGAAEAASKARKAAGVGVVVVGGGNDQVVNVTKQDKPRLGLSALRAAGAARKAKELESV